MIARTPGSSLRRNIALVAAALLLVVLALAVGRDATWKGADQRLVEVITEIRRDYEPWFQPLLVPGAAERYLFGLQALLGTAAIAGIAGWFVGRRDTPSTARRTLIRAVAVTGTAAVAAAALLLVRTSYGEIQALISAIQGTCLGLLGFFAGYPLGRRAAAAADAAGR